MNKKRSETVEYSNLVPLGEPSIVGEHLQLGEISLRSEQGTGQVL